MRTISDLIRDGSREELMQHGYDPQSPPYGRNADEAGRILASGGPPLTFAEFMGRSGTVTSGSKAGRPWPVHIPRPSLPMGVYSTHLPTPEEKFANAQYAP